MFREPFLAQKMDLYVLFILYEEAWTLQIMSYLKHCFTSCSKHDTKFFKSFRLSLTGSHIIVLDLCPLPICVYMCL